MTTKHPTRPPTETKEQEERRRSETSLPAPPPQKFVERMVPAQSISVTVNEVAMRIFTRIYMDTAGRTTEHLANSALDAAEKFIEVAESRKKS